MWSLRLTMTLFYALKSVWFYGTCAWCDFVTIICEHVVLGWVVGMVWLRVTFSVGDSSLIIMHLRLPKGYPVYDL